MNLHFQVTGDGPPLVILHGLLGSLNNWSTLARRLGAHWRVFTVDQRNHGRSPHVPDHSYPAMAADLVEFLDQQGIDRAFVLGHSMGGKTAMEAALRYPDRLRALVVADMPPVAGEGRREELDAVASITPSEYATREEVDAALRVRVPEERVRQFLLTNLRRDDTQHLQWKPNLAVLMASIRDLAAPVSGGRTYPGPALFLRGERSRDLLPSHAPAIRQLFPTAEIRAIPGAGHWLHADAPDAFFAAVVGFLSRC